MIFESNKYEGSKLTRSETYKLLEEWENKELAIVREHLSNQPKQQPKQRTKPPSDREVLQHYLAVRHLCDKVTAL